MDEKTRRQKTKYPGVFYRVADRIGGEGQEKVFYVVYKKEGKLKEEKVGRQYADNMTEAKASSLRSGLIEGRVICRSKKREIEKQNKSKWTIDRLWHEYSLDKPKNNPFKTDDSRYRKYISPSFGDKEPSEIYTIAVQKLKRDLELAKKSPQTVKHVLSLLKRIINYGIKMGLVTAPDTRKLSINLPKFDNRSTEDLTDDQLRNLISVLKSTDNRQVADMMLLVLYTGLRRGEVFKLKWDDLDFDKRFIHIRCPKGGIDHKIPMNELARNLLLDLPRQSDFVFPGLEGGQRKTIQVASNKIKREAGLPEDFRPFHGLRHVYASMLASSGKVDMYTLQKLMTHRTASMTVRYSHLRDEALKKGSDLAATLLDKLESTHSNKKYLNIVK